MSIKKLKVKQGNLKDRQKEVAALENKLQGKAYAKPFNKILQLLNTSEDRIAVRIEKEKAKNKVRDFKPHVVLDRPSPNHSSRGGAVPSIIVLHSTESDNKEGSSEDLGGNANWFANPSSQASSHVITDADGHSARCVNDWDKAWTQAFYNPWSLSIEQIGRAAQTSWADEEVKETARWIAFWSWQHNIPIRRGEVNSTGIKTSGIVTHNELGQLGGGHTDPGSSFPIDKCLSYAKEYRKGYGK